MKPFESFTPDWVSPPGETILDLIEERALSRSEFAEKLQRSSAFVDRLLSGQAEMTSEIAVDLERIFGASAKFWLARETQFRLGLARSKDSAFSTEWLRGLPWREMVKFGWLTIDSDSPKSIEAKCLGFFGVSSLTDWRNRYARIAEMVAFRRSPTFGVNVEAAAAWLRQGEILSTQSLCEKWDPERFRSMLPQMRKLSQISAPERFVPRLKALAAECGVCVAVVRAPSGCPVSGAARFVSPNLALIQLSFRYLSDDHFWFTFFHEVGHLLLHGNTALHLEGVESLSEKEESEANRFAADLLIPPEARLAMRALPARSKDVIRYAVKVGIAPGIVVGQMQHEGQIERRQLNGLKRRFKWSD